PLSSFLAWCEFAPVGNPSRRATSQTVYERDGARGQRWRCSSRAGEQLLVPRYGSLLYGDPERATPAKRPVQGVIADVDLRCASPGHDAVFRRSCTPAAPSPNSWSPDPHDRIE